MNKLERFMHKNKPKKSTSKLAKVSDDILVLKEQGYTLQQIQVYLDEDLKISTSMSNLSAFLKRQSLPVLSTKKTNTVPSTPQSSVKNEEKVELDKYFSQFRKK